MQALDNTTEVETPERIRFRYRAAGPVRRAFAYLLDLLIRAGILLVVSLMIAFATGLKRDDLTNASQGVVLVILFVLEWGYYLAFETLWNGASPGKRAFRLRVVKEGGFPIGFFDSVLRNLLRAADFMPVGYVVGLTVMVGDRRFRRLGDRVAGTMVVVEDRVRVGESLKLTPPATPGELEALPARPPLSADELESLELFLRRGDLSPPRRLELAEMVAPMFARRMGVLTGDPVRFLALLYERCVGARLPREVRRVIQRQDDFVAERRRDWDELEHLLGDGRRLANLTPSSISRAAALYRAVCADLMRAQGAGYGPDVVGLLDGLAARGHNALYSAPPYRLRGAFDLFAYEFPRTLRKYWRLCALATALFLLPGVLGFFAARASRPFALHVLPEAMAEQMEKSYAEGFNKGRSEGQDVGMAGFYVYNNIGIAFRCFATGILLGLGSAFFLVYNGLMIGVVAGLVSRAGHGINLLTFTSGHSSFELSAIVISGAAGMVMGYALVDTGGLTRWASVRRKARDLATLVLGAAGLLLVAALIEGFWSPSGVPAPVKWGVALLNCVMVGLYFTRAGRTRA